MSPIGDAVFYLVSFVLLLLAAFGVDARKVGLFPLGVAAFVFVFLAHAVAGVS